MLYKGNALTWEYPKGKRGTKDGRGVGTQRQQERMTSLLCMRKWMVFTFTGRGDSLGDWGQRERMCSDKLEQPKAMWWENLKGLCSQKDFE